MTLTPYAFFEWSVIAPMRNNHTYSALAPIKQASEPLGGVAMPTTSYSIATMTAAREQGEAQGQPQTQHTHTRISSYIRRMVIMFLEWLAVGSTVANIISTAVQNKKARKYNDVASQAARLKRAGFNANALFHGVGNDQYNPIPLQFDSGFGIPTALQAGADIQLKGEQTKDIKAAKNLKVQTYAQGVYSLLEAAERFRFGMQHNDYIEYDDQGNPTALVGGRTHFQNQWYSEMTGAEQLQSANLSWTTAQAKKAIAEKLNVEELTRLTGIQADKLNAGRSWWMKNERMQSEILEIMRQQQGLNLSEAEVEKAVFDAIDNLPGYVKPWISSLLIALKYFGGSGKAGNFNFNIGQ